MLLAAVFAGYANKPKPADDYETIGQPFYADFEGTSQAKSLLVTSIDPDAIKKQKFEIKEVDGLWQIPSHEGYPAEAAERLARTSASLVGLTRDSLVGRRTSDYEKFGVVDPREDDIVDVESVGQSITIRDANEDVLVDFIIGDRADDRDDGIADPSGEESFYYVRRADETNVYRIPLNIELSTKFSDWIEPDLLQLEAADVVQLDMNNYQIEERSSGMFGQVKELMKVKGDEISLRRKTSTDDWELENLKPESEKVIQAAVNAVVGVLDEMAIVDVEKKPTLNGRILLDADLNYSVTPAQAQLMSIRSQQQLDALSQDEKAEFQSLQMGIMELQRDLEAKGFSFGQTGRKLELVSAGGEMQAGTSSGLRYTLHVGKAPTSTVEAIDVAGASDDDSKKDDPSEEDGGEASDGEEASSKSDAMEDVSESDSVDDSNRYVLIRVAFDESLLNDPGEKPVAPTKPTEPQGYTEASDDEESQGTDSDGATSAVKSETARSDGEEDDDDDDDEAAPKPSKMERNPAFVKYDEDLAAYEEAQVDFEVALSTYTSAASEKEAQIEVGKKKAQILNGRFEKWYYIVSSEKLKTLQSDRAELVEPVITTTSGDEAAAEARAAAKAMVDRPDVSFPEVDAGQKKEPAETEDVAPVDKPAVDKPAVDKPAVDKPEVDKPEVDKPEVDKPEVDKPEVDKPEVDKPEVDKQSENGPAENGPAENGEVKMEEVAQPSKEEGTDSRPEEPEVED